jgi:hypothetical protein
LILLISFSRLKPPIIFSVSLIGTSISFFSALFVCIALFSVVFVPAVCVSAVLVLAPYGSTLFILVFCVSVSFGAGSYTSPLGRIFFGWVVIMFLVLDLRLYLFWSSTIIVSTIPWQAGSSVLFVLLSSLDRCSLFKDLS